MLRDGPEPVDELRLPGRLGLRTPFPADVVLFSSDGAAWTRGLRVTGSDDSLLAEFHGSGIFLAASTSRPDTVEPAGLTTPALGLLTTVTTAVWLLAWRASRRSVSRRSGRR